MYRLSLALLGLYVSTFCFACSPYPLMNQTNFNTIAGGNEILRVEEIYGSSYDIVQLPNGNSEYRYIQRVNVNSTTTDQKEFIFIVRDGRIIDKQVRQVSSSLGCQFQ